MKPSRNWAMFVWKVANPPPPPACLVLCALATPFPSPPPLGCMYTPPPHLASQSHVLPPIPAAVLCGDRKRKRMAHSLTLPPPFPRRRRTVVTVQPEQLEVQVTRLWCCEIRVTMAATRAFTNEEKKEAFLTHSTVGCSRSSCRCSRWRATTRTLRRAQVWWALVAEP